jgi:hypothetical protein
MDISWHHVPRDGNVLATAAKTTNFTLCRSILAARWHMNLKSLGIIFYTEDIFGKIVSLQETKRQTIC